MSKPVITQHQPSLTEWFAAIGEVEESNAFREEDNTKADRLETLYQVIGVPYERPVKLTALDLHTNSPAFQKVMAEQGDELCAIRLIPTKEGLPKLRNRGLPLRECYETWFLQQNIPFECYNADICPHSDALRWSVIMVVTDGLVFGEIVRGLHQQLTQGTFESKPVQFQYDFKSWKWSEKDPEAAREIERILAALHVSKSGSQEELRSALHATFTHDYLEGYFEATVWPNDRFYLIDYNRILPKHIPRPTAITAVSENGLLRGAPASPGKASGSAVVVAPEEIGTKSFSEGSVLVCDATDVRYLPLMRVAAAIITERGGILSHAAIISRELGVPCVVGCSGLLDVVRDGDQLTVDGTTGTISRSGS